jgi:P-aminobenzoate N-oxygenase AurF
MYTDTTGDTLLEKSVIQRLTKTWDTRVAVRRERLDFSQDYDPTIPDFPIAMVPFWTHPAFAGTAEPLRMRLLAGAWIAYNEKTIFVEDEVINPLCRTLLRGELPGVGSPLTKQILAQTAVDEQFHILMCLEVCNHARSQHKLEALVVPRPLLIHRLEETLAQASDSHERALARMAYATVAEMSINAYLRALSSDLTIQPLNRINTDLHRMDEGSHSVIFKELGLSVFNSLGASQRETFKTYVVKALHDFTEPDHSGWGAILKHLEIPGASEILEDLALKSRGRRASRDYTALRGLLAELGIMDDIAFEFA